MWATDYTPNKVLDKQNLVITCDGRMFTDYSTDSTLNERIKKSHDIKNNEQYRTFLVNNTSIVIQSNYETMIKQNGTNNGNTQQYYGPPKLYSDIQDDSKPFGYENTTTKEMYLSREQINDKKRRLIKDEY
jgi:hypothetical protein